jgi:hypothetical protein
MNDQFPPPGWSLRPENWMYRLNAHHAAECRQGSIGEPHRGQVSIRR